MAGFKNFGGFGGGFGGGNMQALMKQAQAMQGQLEKKKEELANSEVEASSGGGMVSVKMTGNKKLVSIKIKQEVVDPDDVEMLEDLITAAFGEAFNKVDELSNEMLGQFKGMM